MIILIQASFEQRDLENPRKGFSSHDYRCIQSNQTNTGTPGLNLLFNLSSSTPIPSLHPTPYLGTPQPTNHTPPFLSLSTSPSRLTNGLPTPQFTSHFIPIPIPIPTCPTHAQHVAAHVFSKYDVQQRRRPSYRDLKSNYHMPWQHQKACWIMEALSQDQTTLFYQGNSQAMRGFGRRDGEGENELY